VDLLTIGIGLGLARHLLRHDAKLLVVATSRSPDETRTSILKHQDDGVAERLRTLNLDVTDEETIHSARKDVEKEFGAGSIKCLFNMSGIVPSFLTTD
jgi:NAD(P)-dependent dehydrogenase (short-subunit alcohol dehydrogenase family)